MDSWRNQDRKKERYFSLYLKLFDNAESVCVFMNTYSVNDDVLAN